MESKKFSGLEEIVPLVQEHLLPEIKRACEVCLKSYGEDPAFNDKWTFGTHLWKNTWNRFKAVAELEDCPFEVWGKGNDYQLKIGHFIVRHHRIDRETTLPNAAKAAKSAAITLQMMLFDGLYTDTTEKGNIIIAIDADTNDGLREVFLGELMPLSLDSNKFRWEKKVRVFLAEGHMPSSEEYVQFADTKSGGEVVPTEEIPEITIGLDVSRVKEKSIESD